MGIAPGDLAVAVCTHNHHDHAGSNIQLRVATGCEIWIHTNDAPGLQKGDRFGEDLIHPHTADRLLNNGDVIQLAGRDHEVIHIPGHSAGSIGLYEPERKLFFSGDALQSHGTTTQGIAGAGDRDAYVRTLDKMDQLFSERGIDHLLAAHPYLPFPDSHVHPSSEVRRYLDECRRFIDEIDDEILDALRAIGVSATAQTLADHICAGRGFTKTCVLAAHILRGYLGRLERAGQLQRNGDLYGTPPGS
jgi:glyoxylase-like metal-dependent hydrolase (beta-lactamase superfamily II)